MRKNGEKKFKELLKNAGCRITNGRLAILAALEEAGRPVSVEHLLKKLKVSLDPVTIYRALEVFFNAKIVERVDLRHSHTHYEFVAGRHHHHHLVCEKCGLIEDVEGCELKGIGNFLLKQTKKFKFITNHSLEFFGLCKDCAGKDTR